MFKGCLPQILFDLFLNIFHAYQLLDVAGKSEIYVREGEW